MNRTRKSRYSDNHVGPTRVLLKLNKEKTTASRSKNNFKILREIIKNKIIFNDITMINHNTAEVTFENYMEENRKGPVSAQSR
jgi:hypothetical protein